MSTYEPLSLPYAHLNLRLNPFGKLTRREKNELVLPRIDLAPYIERLRQPGYAIQFLKEGARNKTTHLLAMRRHFPGSPYVRLRENEAAPAIPDSSVLFIDFLHVMSRADRARLLRQDRSFGIVSHVNHGRELRRAHLEYDLIKLPSYTVAQLAEQIERKIMWARRDPGKPVPTISTRSIARLRSRFDDDVAILSHLYEVFERLTEVGDVKVFD